MKKIILIFSLFLFVTIYPQIIFANQICRSENGKADANCTPGVLNQNVTQANIFSTICVSGYTKTIRPSTAYTNKLKQQQIEEYGYSDANMSDYEEDHLIPLEIGGSPNDPKNLWPEPHNVGNDKGSQAKDKMENELHKKVCDGEMTLKEAQNKILSDWDSQNVLGASSEKSSSSPDFFTQIKNFFIGLIDKIRGINT